MNLDTEDPKVFELWRMAGRFFDPPPRGVLGWQHPPFDTTKPNHHDTKADFLEEKCAVERALAQTEGLSQFLIARYRESHPQHSVAFAVSKYVSEGARNDVLREPSENIAELFRKNATDIGLSFSALLIQLDLASRLKKGKQELESQEALFWNTSGRAPNDYARTIALRFGKRIERETGTCPTVGTSSDGNHPSTDFGRALEDVFQILGIDANFRRAAQWAVAQLSDDDLRPDMRGPLGSILGFGLGAIPEGSGIDTMPKEFLKDR